MADAFSKSADRIAPKTHSKTTVICSAQCRQVIYEMVLLKNSWAMLYRPAPACRRTRSTVLLGDCVPTHMLKKSDAGDVSALAVSYGG